MGHYTGPKGRINRRLGQQIFENGGAKRSLERRDSPPGMQQRRGKPSAYALGLREKQKVKYFYGLSERQLRRFLANAHRHGGNTGEELLMLCERRLDNVVRRSGMTTSRPQARQGIAHGHFNVNGRKTDVASYIVRPGDVIQVRDRKNLRSIYTNMMETSETQPIDWLALDQSQYQIRVLGLPGPEDVSLPVELGILIEFLSR
ncbi:SSU ribosomal protein S4p (S9e) [Planctomycetales bacterium 10988]|nr:SSU ribosomal protein S4p (S9e) [Planctomycetales bacterium 10988]